MAILAWTASIAEAQARSKFDLPPQPLADSLRAVGSQTNVNVLFDPPLIADHQAPALKGEFTTDQAFTLLLHGTGIKHDYMNDRTIVLAAAPTGASTTNDEKSEATTYLLEGAKGATSPREGESFSGEIAQGDGEARGPGFWKRFRLAQAETGASQSSSLKATTDTSDSSRASIGEVIVTATKRAESLQDIPLSVTALDEQLLVKTGAIDMIDYATRVPNLSFGATTENALGANGVQIRGVAGGGGSLGGGTTGFYIDDVPVPETMNPKVMDISRIEVLRGPQGSLYGARSMGGTVRLITKRADPTKKEFDVHATLSDVAEGAQDYAADAGFNIPISENAAFRGNAYYLRESGVHDMRIDNPTVAGDEITRKNVDDGESWGLQAMVTWNVTENFTVEPRFITQHSHIDWLQWSDNDPDNFTNDRVADLADPNDLKWNISSLTLTWDTNWGRFTSASGYFEHDIDSREEMSVPINFLSVILGGNPTYYPPGGVLLFRNQDTQQFTEELRFTSEFDGRVQMTAGVFYSDNRIDSNAPCSFTIGFNEASGFPFGTDCFISSRFIRDIEELAFFGEFEFAILENLFLTAGGRYFDNSLDISNKRTGWVVDFGAPSGPTLFGSQREKDFNPKVALKWEANDDWTLYSSAAKGFRIGGANVIRIPEEVCGDDLAAIGISGSPDTFDSDSLWSYEIGSKSTHFSDRLSVNVAGFFIDWEDIIGETLLPCGFGFTNNTGKAEIKGFELELSSRPIDDLTFNLGVGYTQGEITDPENAAGVAKGDPLPQVPEWMFAGDVEYRFPVNVHKGYIFASYRWIDESISVNAGRNIPRVRDSYELLDARVGMTIGNMDVSLFGKNLTNQHANLSDNVQLTFEVPGRPRYVVNRPRTIGIDIRWQF